jgi:putative tricarboxylic transport membrane protein
VPLGFLLATALLALGVALLFGARWLAALLTGAATSAVLWALFDRVLDLPLPKGPLGF